MYTISREPTCSVEPVLKKKANDDQLLVVSLQMDLFPLLTFFCTMCLCGDHHLVTCLLLSELTHDDWYGYDLEAAREVKKTQIHTMH